VIFERGGNWSACGIKTFGRPHGALSIHSEGFLLTFGWTGRRAGSCRKELEEQKKKELRDTENEEKEVDDEEVKEKEEEEEVKEKVEAMVLGDLMRRGGRRGFPKQLAAISTDPIKINELSLSLSRLPLSPFPSFSLSIQRQRLATGYRRRLLVIVALHSACCWCASFR